MVYRALLVSLLKIVLRDSLHFFFILTNKDPRINMHRLLLFLTHPGSFRVEIINLPLLLTWSFLWPFQDFFYLSMKFIFMCICVFSCMFFCVRGSDPGVIAMWVLWIKPGLGPLEEKPMLLILNHCAISPALISSLWAHWFIACAKLSF